MASRRELILENLKTACEDIQVANGYNWDVKLVTRRLLLPFSFHPKDIPGICIVDRTESALYRGQREIRILGVELLAVCDGGEAQISTRLNSLIEDVLTAIGKDPTRGGNAIDTQLESVTSYQLPKTPLGFAEFNLTITYPELNLNR